MWSDVALGLEGAIIMTALQVALGLQEAITRRGHQKVRISLSKAS